MILFPVLALITGLVAAVALAVPASPFAGANGAPTGALPEGKRRLTSGPKPVRQADPSWTVFMRGL